MAVDVPTSAVAVTEGAEVVGLGRPPRRFIRAVLRNRKAMAGVVILLLMVFVAVFPGLIAPYDPQATAFAPDLNPSWSHLLGTTNIGQDVFSQLIWSTRLTLEV